VTPPEDPGRAPLRRSLDRARIVRGLGLGISALICVLLARTVDWRALADAFARASGPVTALAIALIVLCYAISAQRWRSILGPPYVVPYLRLARFTMIGYLGNLVFPLRAGDVLRIALLRDALGGAGGRALGTVALERVLDVLTVCAFGGVLLAFVEVPPAIAVGVGLMAAAALAGLVLLLVLARAPSLAWGARIAALLPRRWAMAVSRGIVDLVEGLATLSPARLLVVFALSGCQWGAAAIAMVACVAAFEPGLPWGAGVLLLVTTNLGSAIPSAPGSFGVFHGLGVLALGVWSVPLPVALAIATLAHGVTSLVQLVLGSVAAAREGGLLTLRENLAQTPVHSPARAPQSPKPQAPT